jgi:hypothetical protein
VTPRHDDADHAATSLTGNLHVFKLFLSLLQVFLHLLRLTHQIADTAFHHDLSPVSMG